MPEEDSNTTEYNADGSEKHNGARAIGKPARGL